MSRADKAAKQQKDRYHAILRELVKELPNKTCADCLGKGPRWASWSLGVFVCIRCAGIHRNLGVHLSKVKSVDLDSWNTQQIENMLKWGNKRAAEYFECYLPTDFTRPSSNHAVEAFIRNKYEKKQYIMKGGEPEPNPSSKLNMLKTDSSSTADKEKEKSTKRKERTEKKKEQKEEENTILKVANQTVQEKPSVKSLSTPQPPQQHKSSSMNDLLSLDTPAPQQPAVVKPSASSNDLLFSTNDQQPTAPEMDLFGLSNTTNGTLASVENNVSPTQPQASEPQKSTKESILSLYGSSSSQAKPQYGVPGGVYMPQQQMFPNQMNQLNMQMQQMSTTQQPTNYNQFNMQYQQQQPNQTPQFQQKQQFQQFQQPNQQFQQPNQQFQQSNQQFQQKQNFQQSNQQQFQPNQQFQQPNQQFQQFNNFSQANQFTNQQASFATSSANSFPNQSAFSNGFGGITNKNAFATTNQNGFPQQNRYAAPTNQLSQNQNFGAQQNGGLMQQNGWSQQTQQPSNTGQTMNNLLWS